MEGRRLDELALLVERLDRLGRQVAEAGADFPALERNAVRLLATVRMMRLNLGLPEPDSSGKR